MQAVILAGGLATRLRPLSEKNPKSMVLVNKKPFLEYQLDLFKRSGVFDVLLCVGHLGDSIEGYFGDGKKFGVNLTYSRERKRLLGTAGALKNAEKLLEKEFFLIYGDSYLPMDYRKPLELFHSLDKMGLNVVYKNHDKYEKSNMAVKDALVVKYSKDRGKDLMYIDAGLSIFKKRVLELIPSNQVFQLTEVFNELIRKRELLAFEAKQRFYQIGSFGGLEEVRKLLAEKN